MMHIVFFMQLVAILAFSLVAGYTATGTTTCDRLISTGIDVRSEYPFFAYDSVVTINGQEAPNGTDIPFREHVISAQFFVAWGVLTMIYCVVALVVYMLFTANENLEKVVDMLIYIVS